MKIRLNYNPADKELQSWVFDPDEIDNLEAERIEIVGDEMWDSYGQWWLLLLRGNTRAIRALLWIMLKRTQPDLDFNEIRFLGKEVGLEDVKDEPVGKDEPAADDTGSPSAPPDLPPDSEN